jgi:hypothetical protein
MKYSLRSLMIVVILAPPLLALGIVAVQREIRRRQELARPQFPTNLSILTQQTLEPGEIDSQIEEEPLPNSSAPVPNPPSREP